MLPLALSLALFAFWSLVGRAVLVLVRSRSDCFQAALLAPVMGVATTVLLLLLLNRLGAPVETMGPALAVVLLLTSGVVLVRYRPSVPWRAIAPFGAIAVATLVVVGRPAFEFGFAWISYANDDMGNYVLLAQQLLHRGFFDPADLDTILSGRDYSQVGYYFHYLFNIRPGAQLLLAWTQSLTGLTGHQAFMPTILAFHLVLVCSAAEIAYLACCNRRPAYVVALLMAFSPLTVQATLNQLIAQVVGLALLASSSAALLARFDEKGWRDGASRGVQIAILVGALCACYPEALPFLGLAFVVHLILGAVRREILLAPTARVLGSGLVAGVIVLNTFIPGVLVFMFSQFERGTVSARTDVDAALFPMYLIPSGLADLWGFQRLDALPGDPMQSITIIAGAILLGLAALTAGVLAWRRHAAAVVTSVMVLLAISLFASRSAFGLYKLAMFVQPFVLATLTVACVMYMPRRINLLPVLVLGLLGLPVSLGYIETSRGIGTAVQIPNGSAVRINDQFQTVLNSMPPGPLVLDNPNLSLETFQVVYTRGRDVTFPTRNLLTTFFTPCFEAASDTVYVDRPDLQAICRQAIPARFDLHDPAAPGAVNPFTINGLGDFTPTRQGCTPLIATTARQQVFNRRTLGKDLATDFVGFPCGTSNHLIFVNSELGQYYFPSDQEHVGLFALEREPLWGSDTFAGIGRHLLMYVLNPTDTVRLSLTFTATLKSDGQNELPAAAAIADDRQPFPMLGRGSARVFSPPLKPQIIDGRAYVALDMGEDGRRFPELRSGAMALYGTDVPRDPRRLTGFLRDLSLVSDAEYDAMHAPDGIATFPGDLQQSNLEYSGIYEDGWISEASYLSLNQSPGATVVTIRGVLPNIDDPGPSDLTVFIDGVEASSTTIQPGEFDVRTPVTGSPGRHRVEMRFSRLQHLPSPDSRPVAALIHTIAYE